MTPREITADTALPSLRLAAAPTRPRPDWATAISASQPGAPITGACPDAFPPGSAAP